MIKLVGTREPKSAVDSKLDKMWSSCMLLSRPFVLPRKRLSRYGIALRIPAAPLDGKGPAKMPGRQG